MAGGKLVFSQTMEALFVRALGGSLTPAGRERLRLVGLDVSRPLLPAYAFDVWMGCLRVGAEDAYPGVPLAEAMHRMGVAYLEGYRSTLMGRAVFGLLRVLGPRRALERATHNFRSGNNYTESRLVQRGPTSFTLWMNEVGPYPTFTAGIIQAGMEAAGAHAVEVTVEAHDGAACTYAVRWSEAAQVA